MFSNETEETVRKVEARAAPKHKASPAKAITPECSGNSALANQSTNRSVDGSSTSLSLLPNLTPTIDERAVAFFFSNHVLGIDSPSRGFIEYVQTDPGYDFGDSLMCSLKAVGLAGFANTAKASGIMAEAKKQYLVAVRVLNTALQSPIEAKKDSTLLAVMILGIFETLAGRTEDSLVAWAAHLNGAAALMKLRGPEQVSTIAGRRLYGQITASLATSCLGQEVGLPDHIWDLRLELEKHVDPKDISWQNHRVLLLFTNFYAKVKRKQITDLQEILDTSLSLESSLVDIFRDMPNDWTYSTVYTNKDPDIVYYGCYHVYQHALSAMMWNGMRTIRALLNEIIRNVLLTGFAMKPPMFTDAKYTKMFQISTDSLYKINFDIIASVPQHLGYTTRNTSICSPKSQFDAQFSSSEPVLPNLRNERFARLGSLPEDISWERSSSNSVPLLRTAGYQLPWALFLVGVTDIATEPVLRWAISMLKHISEYMGIQQATVLAEKLERERLPSFTGKGR